MSITPETLAQYRQRLLTQQRQIVQRLYSQEEAMYAMDADRDIERTDRVQEVASEFTLMALDEQERRELEAIQVALARIDAGTYGLCDRCQDVIPAARLEALPMARYCLACQTHLEHPRKRP